MSDIERPAPRKQNVVPMLRRIGEVIGTILSLVNSVAQLKAKNDALTAKVKAAQACCACRFGRLRGQGQRQIT